MTHTFDSGGFFTLLVALAHSGAYASPRFRHSWTLEVKQNTTIISRLGGIQQLLDRILPFLTPLLHGQFFAWTVFVPWAWTKIDIFWPPPPSSRPRSYWMTPRGNQISIWPYDQNLYGSYIFQISIVFYRTSTRFIYFYRFCFLKSNFMRNLKTLIRSIYFHDLLYVHNSWSNFKNKIETSQVGYFAVLENNMHVIRMFVFWGKKWILYHFKSCNEM